MLAVALLALVLVHLAGVLLLPATVAYLGAELAARWHHRCKASWAASRGSGVAGSGSEQAARRGGNGAAGDSSSPSEGLGGGGGGRSGGGVAPFVSSLDLGLEVFDFSNGERRGLMLCVATPRLLHLGVLLPRRSAVVAAGVRPFAYASACRRARASRVFLSLLRVCTGLWRALSPRPSCGPDCRSGHAMDHACGVCGEPFVSHEDHACPSAGTGGGLGGRPGGTAARRGVFRSPSDATAFDDQCVHASAF